MQAFDQKSLDKLVAKEREDPGTIKQEITSNCIHRRFDDIDCTFVCGIDGGYDTCKCVYGELCEDFELDDASLE